MKLLFKQRFFSWFDSYDIYNEDGQVIYQVEGKLSWGHKLVIYDQNRNEVGTVLEKVITLLPKFEIYKIMHNLASTGKSVIVFSSEFPEIWKTSHRCIVMYKGEINTILDRENITEENIMYYATGSNLEVKND